MRIRKTPTQPGLECSAADPASHLPDGLAPGTRLTVETLQGWHIIVRAADGRSWELNHWQIERWQCQGPSGIWHDEAEPHVLDRLEEEYRKIAADRWSDACECTRAEVLGSLATILRRQGRAVPDVQPENLLHSQDSEGRESPNFMLRRSHGR